MKFFTFFAVLFFSAFSFAQGQEGYYITNSGQKVDGFFKVTDFYNANSLQFSTNNTDFKSLDADNIKEYGIGNAFKFQKYTIQLESSDNSDVKNFSPVKDPVYNTSTVFLNVIMEGKVSLYSYEVNKSTRYFYKKENSPEIVQLIYKKYKPTQGAILENNYYRQQIFTQINCGNKPTSAFSNTAYGKSTFTRIFTEENECLGSTPVYYTNSGSRETKFLYTVFGGLYSSQFSLEGNRYASGKGTDMSYGFGGELSLVVPSGKWEAFVRVEYEMLSAEAVTVTKQVYNTVENTAILDANAFNVYVGPRYNLILNEKNKIFADAALGLSIPSGDVTINSVITTNAGDTYESETGKYPLSNTICANLSVGYVFNDKIGVALKYETNRNMFDNTNVGYGANIGRIGVNLRYTIN